jgi:hypothetical protein
MSRFGRVCLRVGQVHIYERVVRARSLSEAGPDPWGRFDAVPLEDVGSTRVEAAPWGDCDSDARGRAYGSRAWDGAAQNVSSVVGGARPGQPDPVADSARAPDGNGDADHNWKALLQRSVNP